MHGLQGTLTSILFESHDSCSYVAMITGNRDPRSLKLYQYLTGSKGSLSQRTVLFCGGSGSDQTCLI